MEEQCCEMIAGRGEFMQCMNKCCFGDFEDRNPRAKQRLQRKEITIFF
jgi:hypothetical protein